MAEDTPRVAEIRRGRRWLIAAAAWGGACLQLGVLWPHLPRNPPVMDGAVVAAYLCLYALFYGWAGWLILGISRAAAPGPTTRLFAWIGARLAGSRGLALAAGMVAAAVALPVSRVAPAWIDAAPPVELQASWGPSPYRITLLGMDGADLDLIDGLIAEGRLPAFKRLMAEGVAGPMETISPHSPVVWTAMATGLPEARHGVSSYTTTWLTGTGVAVPRARVDFLGRWLDRGLHLTTEGAVSSNDRRVKAAWEILSQLQLPSLIVNWWATFPAETIDGIMVSNHLVPWTGFQRDVLAHHLSVPGLVAPASLAPQLVGMLQPYVAEHHLEDVERNAFTVAGYQYYKARDDLVFQVFDDLRTPDFALATVYAQGIDTASHAFTSANFGKNVNKRRRPRLKAAEADRLYADLVEGAYERMDVRLGAYLDQRGEGECLIVVSDHGWAYDGTSHWEHPDGIFMAVGGPFQEGARIRAHVYDVLPTMAHLLGLPISEELPGRVLVDALHAGWLAAHPPAFVPTYGARGAPISVVPPAEDDAHMERLRSLGYVE